MMDKKEQRVLAEMKQYGYDRNIVALTYMKGDPELEQQFEELTCKVITSVRDCYANLDKQFEEDEKKQTVMRFCFTVGIGSAWFWVKKKDEVKVHGLFECMAQPRTAFEMDEYIEDVTGIWWSSHSIHHNNGLQIVEDCMDILKKHYELDNKEDELQAGHVMMLFGMYYGYTRIAHDNAIVPYQGQNSLHWVLLQELYGIEKGDEYLDEVKELAWKSLTEGTQGRYRDVVLDDPDSEFGKINYRYYPYTLKEKAGIRSLTYAENNKLRHHTSIPVFDSARNYYLILDRVHVWESGAEATLEAHFPNDENFHIRFYDTHYLENKDKYFVGLGYMFDLYAIAIQATIVPEDQRSLTLEGEQAVRFNENLGQEPVYDANGNPEPLVLQTVNMNAFFQVNEKYLELAEFRAPIKKVHHNVKFLDKKIYEVEIGMPYHCVDKDDKQHYIFVYLAPEYENGQCIRPREGEPLQGHLYVQGRMRSEVVWGSPSNVLHTFEAKNDDGLPAVFEHLCDEPEKGLPMSEEEVHEFAKKVYFQHLSGPLRVRQIAEKEDKPDFVACRERDIWIKADVNYTANEDFIREEKSKYLGRYYRSYRIPVVTYISLYDVDGNECKWLKGGMYTAKIHYGSVLPGQKMEIMHPMTHDSLVEKLYESFEKLDCRSLSKYLHKDLDFRSVNIADPIITREEYLSRTEQVNLANKRAMEGPVKPIFCYDDEEGAYIEMCYPHGAIDVVKVKTSGGFITAISIENKETGRVGDT